MQWTTLLLQWNLRNKATNWAIDSGFIFEVVLILRTVLHVYTDLGLNQSGLIPRWAFSGVSLYQENLLVVIDIKQSVIHLLYLWL